MVKKCVVPYCRSGYSSCPEKVSIFTVPRDKLEEWQKAISRTDRKLTVKDGVCAKHFQRSDIMHTMETECYSYELKIPRLTKDAVPSIFPKRPKCLTNLRKKRGNIKKEYLPNKKKKTDSKNIKQVDNSCEECLNQQITKDKECKKSWNALRDGFRRAIKRQKEIKRAQESAPLKKWKYDEELAFLVPYLRERPRTSVCDGKEEEENVDIENITSDKTLDSTIAPSSPPASPTLTKKSKLPETSSTVVMRYVLDKNGDEIDAFFYSMAATVKKFSPRLRAIAKAEVFSAISKLELEVLEQPSSTTAQYLNSPLVHTFQPSPSNVSSDNYETDEDTKPPLDNLQDVIKFEEDSTEFL